MQVRQRTTIKELNKKQKRLHRKRCWQHFLYRQRRLRERFGRWIGRLHDQCYERIAIWRGYSLHTFLIYLEQNDGSGFVPMWKDGKCFQAHAPEWAARQARDEASNYGVPWTQERFSHPRTFVYLHVRDSLWKIPDGQRYPGLTPYRVFPLYEKEHYQERDESDEISGNYSVLWNGEAALLLDIRTPEQQREEWMSDAEVVEGWYESGEDEEPVFETLYEIQDRYGVSHVISEEKKFHLIQQGYFYCITCGQIQPSLFLAKRRQGDCVCATCVEQPATRKFRIDWIDEQEGAEPNGNEFDPK